MKVFLHRASKRTVSEKGSFIDHNDDRQCQQNRFGALCLLHEREIEPLVSCELYTNREMGIVTIVTRGLLEYKDNDGSRGITSAGQIQYVGTGKNSRFLEHNPSAIEKTELVQLWIIPRKKGFTPRYEQRNCDMDRFNRWALLISENGRKNSLRIEQDMRIRGSHLFFGHTLVSDPLNLGYGRVLFVLDGEVNVCGHILKRRDELHVIGDEPFEIIANRDAHLLLIDIPMDDFE